MPEGFVLQQIKLKRSAKMEAEYQMTLLDKTFTLECLESAFSPPPKSVMFRQGNAIWITCLSVGVI